MSVSRQPIRHAARRRSPRAPFRVLGALAGFVALSVGAGLLVAVGIAPVVAVAGQGTTSAVDVFQKLPEDMTIGATPQRNELYAYKDGKSVPFATVYDQNREDVSWDQIAATLKNAAVDGEDKRFYQEGGIDPQGVARAAAGSVAGGGLGDAGGASTITMQLVRNIKMVQALDLPTEAARTKAYNEATQTTLPRKLQEMKLAIGLNKKYTKKQILTSYLNIAYFGDNTYGVQAAAQHYFNVNASAVTPLQAASLIAIVQSPNDRNLASPKNYAANEARRNVILRAMHTAGHLTGAELAAAVATPAVKIVALTPATQGCQSSVGEGSQFFCDYAIRIVKQLPQLGSTQAARDAAWRTGGYKIQTTLDLDLNAQEKQLISQWVPNTETRIALGGTIDSVEASTGRIVVMAQNKNYNQSATAPSTDTSLNYSVDQDEGGGEGFQTGSTYKLFTLLDWLEKGHTLTESVNATRRLITPMTQCGTEISPGTYIPKNDEGDETGIMSVQAATTQSVNVAYMSMAQQLDLCDIRDTAESMGVHLAAPRTIQQNGATTTTTAPDVNISSVLGTNNIAPLTMASAYATIANDGTYCSPIAIDSITGPSGKSLGGQPRSCEQVIPVNVARTAAEALRPVLTRGTAAGATTADGYDEFGKTGTTDNAEQIWLVGSTTKITTALWMGNTDGKTLNLRYYAGPEGYTYAVSRAPLWRAAQTIVNTHYPAAPFPAPTPPVNEYDLAGTGTTTENSPPPTTTSPEPATGPSTPSPPTK